MTYTYEQYTGVQQLCREYTSNRNSILDRFSNYLEAAVKLREPDFKEYTSAYWRHLNRSFRITDSFGRTI